MLAVSVKPRLSMISLIYEKKYRVTKVSVEFLCTKLSESAFKKEILSVAIELDVIWNLH